VRQPVNAWGSYVYAKVNAVALFTAELDKLRGSGRSPSLLLSSVTDPYQSVEKQYRLTRGILETLAREPYPGIVGILTKSPLVLRDVDLLGALPGAEVGLTVTTTDDRLGRFLEVRAPRASQRLGALAALRAHGIHTYAFVGRYSRISATSPPRSTPCSEALPAPASARYMSSTST
jgi:DNA repair photolyase